MVGQWIRFWVGAFETMDRCFTTVERQFCSEPRLKVDKRPADR